MARKEEVEVSKADNTIVLACRCISPAQDRFYGVGLRAHNRTKQSKQAAEQRWRCTVCRDEKGV